MKLALLSLGVLWMGFLPPVAAQVRVRTSYPHQSYLLHESIPVTLEISNYSGETIQLGGEDPNANLRLVVRTSRNRIVRHTNKKVFGEMWVIPDGITSSRTFDLVQLFEIREAQSYRAEMRLSAVGESWSLDPYLFSVKNGTVHERVRRRATDRTFSLISVNRSVGDEMLMRVSDYQGRTTLQTYSLERASLFMAPDMRVDANGDVHVLFYRSNTMLVYCRFKGDGTPVGREYLRPGGRGMRLGLEPHPEFGFWVPGAVGLPEENGGGRTEATVVEDAQEAGATVVEGLEPAGEE